MYPTASSEEPIAELGGPMPPDKRLQLFEDRLRVVSTSGEVLDEIPRSDLPRALTLLDGLFIRRTLNVRGAKRHHGFPLPPDQFEQLVEWLRLDREFMRAVLKRHYTLTIPIALIFIFGSLPLDADPTTGSPAIPLDVVGMALGGSLLALAALSWITTHRVLFLVDATWFAAVSVRTIVDVLGGSSPLWLAIVVISAGVIVSRIREFQRFAPRGSRRDGER